MGEFRNPRWGWESKDTAVRSGYMAVDGRVSLAELVAHMHQIAPYASLDDIQVNFATVKWTRPGTADEVAEREEQHRRWQERLEKWERETLARLTQKYGAP